VCEISGRPQTVLFPVFDYLVDRVQGWLHDAVEVVVRHFDAGFN
jgi:hypothetical protein